MADDPTCPCCHPRNTGGSSALCDYCYPAWANLRECKGEQHPEAA